MDNKIERPEPCSHIHCCAYDLERHGLAADGEAADSTVVKRVSGYLEDDQYRVLGDMNGNQESVDEAVPYWKSMDSRCW